MVRGVLQALGQPLALSGPPASPSYIDGLGIKAAAFGEGEDGAEDRKERGLCGAEEGFGHGWSAQPLPLPRCCPRPAPACSASRSRAAATSDRGLKSMPGLHQSPGKGRAAGLKGKGTRRGLCPTPTLALPASHLVSK